MISNESKQLKQKLQKYLLGNNVISSPIKKNKINSNLILGNNFFGTPTIIVDQQ